jgi:simple sugar transport system ATP-binding protein
VTLDSPRAARRLGIGLVRQHPSAIPALTVAENVALAAGWRPVPRKIERRVAELGERLGLPVDPRARAGDLSVGLRQRIELLSALAPLLDRTDAAPILLLDEPTAILAPAEAAGLLALVRRLADGGAAVALITHKLDEALAAADRVTVLRRGATVLTGSAAAQRPAALAAVMLGGAPPPDADASAADTAPRVAGPVLARALELQVEREGGGLAVRGVSLELHAGEIVGIAAVEGNGQRELLRAVAGVLRPVSGVLDVAAPVAFIPEDRTTEGLIGELSLTENVVLAPRDAPWLRGGRIDWRAAEQETAELIARRGIRAAGPRARAATLSGGNQQKLLLGRALAQRPRVLVAENPARGLDVGAAAEIHTRLRRAAAEGAAVLLHAGDLDDVLAIADRLLVMSRGRLLTPPSGADRQAIGALMLGGG